jgi:D-ribose pyranase
MIKSGILNPHILSLVARVRHTNMLVIADRGFPFWPMIETVDISLVDGVPTVLQVFQAVTAACAIGQVYMAEEFLAANTAEVKANLNAVGAGIPFSYEPHVDLKKRVPAAIGLIRTGDVIQYANMILVSA